MLMEHIFQCVDDIYEDVMKEGSPDLKARIQNLEEVAGKSTVPILKKGIMLSMTFCLNQLQFHDELFETLLMDNIEYMIENIPDMKKTIQLQVSLRGLEQYVNRQVVLPYYMTLADLAYALLAMFQADGSHLFTFECEQGKFGCQQCDEEMIEDYASNVFLNDLDLKKGSCFSLWYDFGDDYLFDIQVIHIQNEADLNVIGDGKILSGNGYGIWEDEHELLEMYYTDYEMFIERIQDFGLDEEDFIFDDFDLDASNEMFVENFEFLRRAYEDGEEEL